MPLQKWNVDMEKVQKIFIENKSPGANDLLREYLAKEIFPLREGASDDEKAKRDQELHLAFLSTQKRARQRGWFQKYHNSCFHASAWPGWKKKLYTQLHNKGLGEEELAEHNVFKEDFAACNDTKSAVRNFARSLRECSAKKRNEAIAKRKAEVKPPDLPTRRWPEAEVIEISQEAWDRPGSRVAYFSYGPYRAEGWRRGLFVLGGLIFALEGCRFPVFAGGFLSKEWVTDELKRLSEGVPKQFLPDVESHVMEETARALQWVLPRFKRPDGKLTRWYMMDSKPFDGPHGKEIIKRLQALRPEDVRQYKTGGEKVEVRMDGQPSVYHGVVLPKRSRLHSKYMSAKVETDIEDVEDQTSRDYPHLWVHGTSATAIYKPAGERTVPYISIPALKKLEAEDKKIAENQVGITIVEEMPDGDRLVHVWNFRDLIANEREFITGIKEGATDFHKKIAEILKREGARHPGRLADDLDVEQSKLEEEIKFLVEPKRSLRLTWPGLHYDEASQRYDFHLDWIQEVLRYVLPSLDKDGWHEDSFLFFGCLHAGYTTTDYEFVVEKFVEKILQYDIKILGGIGDFIAGLAYYMMHRGEIIGSLNNTEQEQFAGEIKATIIYKVFVTRFEKWLKGLNGRIPSKEEVLAAVDLYLLLVFIKKGNHDRWQERDGNTALGTFYRVLVSLLIKHIGTYLSGKGFVGIDVREIVEKKMVFLPEHRPVYTLPSGIKVALIHPHMARADTTSLRVEKALKKFSKLGCQVVGVANFHVATSVHKWRPKTGQAIAVQIGTQVIDTDFEYNKLKDLDFGPMYLKVLSYKGRIYRTTVAAFNKPILEEPYRKDIDVPELKKKLGLLGYS